MIRYHTYDHPPHLHLELDGTITGRDVRHVLADLPNALQRLPPAFLALITYADVLRFHTDATGPLFYFIAHILSAEPGLSIFVEGPPTSHAGLRHFISKVGRFDRLLFVREQKDAETFLRNVP